MAATTIIFKVTPNLQAFAIAKDCPIDAQNIHELILSRFPLFDGGVYVDHAMGNVQITINNSLTQTQLDNIRNGLKQMAVYVSGLP